MYLLDANVLIDANRDYYPIDRVPEFWEWLEYQGKTGRIKIPIEIYEEFKDGPDTLAQWAKQDSIELALLLNEEVDEETVASVVDKQYAPDLTDEEVEKIGRDPFLIAYALVDPDNRHVVTTEVSSPSKTRANRRVPDVCRDFGVSCLNAFELTRVLNFRTNWR